MTWKSLCWGTCEAGTGHTGKINAGRMVMWGAGYTSSRADGAGRRGDSMLACITNRPSGRGEGLTPSRVNRESGRGGSGLTVC